MKRVFAIVSLPLVLVLSFSFTDTARVIDPPAPAPATASRESIFYERWQAYVDWESELPFQDHCAPFLEEPDEGTAYRGTVVLLHGFSACPQQYYDLAGLLAEAGFRSIVPLLPGHGRPWPAFDQDDSGALPGPWMWQDAYDAFADQVNGIMTYADGERVIGGLSGGGAAALYLNHRARDLYNRSLVMAPFLAIAGGDVVNGGVTTLGTIPIVNLLSATPFGTADFCLDKRREGKASYCKWQVRHVAGMKALGRHIAATLARDPLPVRMQVVGVEGDNSVSNDRVVELVREHAGTGAMTACLYPEGVPHSMFSRYDHPGEDMYWLDDFNTAAIAFITAGTAFPARERPGLPVRECRLDEAPAAAAG
jgi:alpha-beta hydrolase superfamily lysophospholipase